MQLDLLLTVDICYFLFHISKNVYFVCRHLYFYLVDYLDVTLNLNDGKYRPFHKPNKETTYIHVESDDPPQIIKKIPRLSEKRLSHLSSTKEIFENAKDYYEQRLRQCGYNEKLNYTEENNKIKKKSRKRNIL